MTTVEQPQSAGLSNLLANSRVASNVREFFANRRTANASNPNSANANANTRSARSRTNGQGSSLVDIPLNSPEAIVGTQAEREPYDIYDDAERREVRQYFIEHVNTALPLRNLYIQWAIQNYLLQLPSDVDPRSVSDQELHNLLPEEFPLSILPLIQRTQHPYDKYALADAAQPLSTLAMTTVPNQLGDFDYIRNRKFRMQPIKRALRTLNDQANKQFDVLLPQETYLNRVNVPGTAAYHARKLHDNLTFTQLLADEYVQPLDPMLYRTILSLQKPLSGNETAQGSVNIQPLDVRELNFAYRPYNADEVYSDADDRKAQFVAASINLQDVRDLNGGESTVDIVVKRDPIYSNWTRFVAYMRAFQFLYSVAAKYYTTYVAKTADAVFPYTVDPLINDFFQNFVTPEVTPEAIAGADYWFRVYFGDFCAAVANVRLSVRQPTELRVQLHAYARTTEFVAANQRRVYLAVAANPVVFEQFLVPIRRVFIIWNQDFVNARNDAYVDALGCWIGNEMTETWISAMFPLIYGTFRTFDAAFYSNENAALLNHKQFPVIAILMQKLDTPFAKLDILQTLRDYCKAAKGDPTVSQFADLETTLQPRAILSLFAQLTFGLGAMQAAFGYVHNDGHLNNWFVEKTSVDHVLYYYNAASDSYVAVPTYGNIVKLIDHGRAAMLLDVPVVSEFDDEEEEQQEEGGEPVVEVAEWFYTDVPSRARYKGDAQRTYNNTPARVYNPFNLNNDLTYTFLAILYQGAVSFDEFAALAQDFEARNAETRPLDVIAFNSIVALFQNVFTATPVDSNISINLGNPSAVVNNREVSTCAIIDSAVNETGATPRKCDGWDLRDPIAFLASTNVQNAVPAKNYDYFSMFAIDAALVPRDVIVHAVFDEVQLPVPPPIQELDAAVLADPGYTYWEDVREVQDALVESAGNASPTVATVVATPVQTPSPASRAPVSRLANSTSASTPPRNVSVTDQLLAASRQTRASAIPAPAANSARTSSIANIRSNATLLFPEETPTPSTTSQATASSSLSARTRRTPGTSNASAQSEPAIRTLLFPADTRAVANRSAQSLENGRRASAQSRSTNTSSYRSILFPEGTNAASAQSRSQIAANSNTRSAPASRASARPNTVSSTSANANAGAPRVTARATRSVATANSAPVQ